MTDAENTVDLALGEGKTVFVVSPIGSKLEPLGSAGRSRYEENLVMWADVIEPACAQFGLKPVRSDTISDPGEIPDQIFKYLRDADVVIADVSNGNPNVMYELGLRHSKPGVTIQIGEYARLPFDVQTIRTQQFIRNEAGLIAARNELVESLRSGLKAGATDLRATRVFTEDSDLSPEIVSADAAKSAAADAEEDDEESGVLEVAAEGEAALKHVGQVLTAATEQMARFNELSQEFNIELKASDAAGKGFAGRLLVVKKYDEEFHEPATEFEDRSNEFFADIERVDALVRWALQRQEDDPSELADAPDYAASILGLINAAEKGAVGITQMRNSARQLRKLAKALSNTSQTIERGANRLLEGIAIMSQWREQAERVAAL